MQPVTKAIEIMENSFSVIYLSPLAAILAGLRRDPLPPELDQLAEEIKLQTATADPIAIGVLLRKAKAKIPHGQWAAWFEEEHFAFPRHVAIECMRLAKQRPLAAADRQQATKMSEVIRRQIQSNPKWLREEHAAMTEEFTQAEKRKVMKDTLFSRAQAEIGEELGGRFKHLAPAPVTGIPQYPRAAASHRDPTGPVAPLGFRVDAIEPVGTPAETERSIAQLAAGSPPFPAADEGPTPGVCLGPSGVGPGRPSTSTERRRA